jgi:predicted Zn-dependent protease
MIKKHSDDPNVAEAAEQALEIVKEVLAAQPRAEQFNYGGHELNLNEYGVCTTCSSPIGEAQQVASSLRARAEEFSDETVKEHLELAAQLFETEAQAAIIRAKFHNGHNTEPILNVLLGYQHERSIHDTYEHSHGGSPQ